MADNGFKINKSINLNPQTSAPDNPVDGDIYYDSTAQSFAYYHDGAWANFDSVGTVASTTWMTSIHFSPEVVRNSVIKVIGGAVLSHLAGISASFSAKRITVYNAGTATIVVEPEDSHEGTANNKIQTPTGGSMNLVAGEVAVFTYDVAASRWLLVSISSNAGAQVIATTSNPGLVTLHKASLLPLDGVVLSDGDLNTANGVVGLDANRAVNIAAPLSGQHVIHGMADPTLDQDVATKYYADTRNPLRYWEEQTVPAAILTSELYDLAWGNGRWVAVGLGGALISDDGVFWYGVNGPSGLFGGVVYGGGLFVAVGATAGQRVSTSPDGITWTPRSVPASAEQQWYKVAWNGTRYVAISNLHASTQKVMTSLDGINWAVTSAAGAANDSWQAICWTGSVFVATGADIAQNGIIMTSPDGITWTTQSAPVGTRAISGVAWNGTKVVAVGHYLEGAVGALRIITSTTGTSAWSTVSLPAYFPAVALNNGATVGNRIAAGNGFFAATVARAGWGAYGVIVSRDGVNWYLRKTPRASIQWNQIAFGGPTDQFAVLGMEGSNNCLISCGI